MQGILFLAVMLCCRDAPCRGPDLLAGVYLDTVNRVNLKAGIALSDAHEYDPQRPYYYGGFRYADVEYGLEGAKLSVGVGQHIGHGADRVGLSYARLEEQDLVGVEAVISQMGLSLKTGYYIGLDGTDNVFLLGLGLGL